MGGMMRCFRRWTLMLLAGAAALSGADLPAQEASIVGEVAPDFEVKEWINGTGKTSLKDCAGQLVLVEIWSTG
jgi:hypothetical protein